METNRVNLSNIEWFNEHGIILKTVPFLKRVTFDGHYFIIDYDSIIDTWKPNEFGKIMQICYFVNKDGNWYGGPFMDLDPRTMLVDCHDIIYKMHDISKPYRNDLVAVCLLNMDHTLRTNYCYVNWR